MKLKKIQDSSGVFYSERFVLETNIYQSKIVGLCINKYYHDSMEFLSKFYYNINGDLVGYHYDESLNYSYERNYFL